MCIRDRSLYLDCYENGKREYEALHLYLIPEVNEDAKRENKNAMKKAVVVEMIIYCATHYYFRKNKEMIN